MGEGSTQARADLGCVDGCDARQGSTNRLTAGKATRPPAGLDGTVSYIRFRTCAIFGVKIGKASEGIEWFAGLVQCEDPVMTPRTRRTVMYFSTYPPTSKVLGWVEFLRRRREDMSMILWCRVLRKTPKGRIVGGTCRVECRQLPPKWHDKSGITGMIEAVATWEEA